ncbi:hypothetical protein NN561_020068 [Cricetulus griseus]
MERLNQALQPGCPGSGVRLKTPCSSGLALRCERVWPGRRGRLETGETAAAWPVALAGAVPLNPGGGKEKKKRKNKDTEPLALGGSAGSPAPPLRRDLTPVRCARGSWTSPAAPPTRQRLSK